MKPMVRRNFGMVTLGSTVALLPVVLYAASQQDANGLYVFSQGDKILSKEVNDNFKVVSDFMTTYEDALTVDELGNIGVGVANPSAALDVNGTVKATSFAGDGSALTGISGLSQWSNVSGGIGYSGGNVGIGTMSPASLLSIQGTTPTFTIRDNSTNSPSSGDISSRISFDTRNSSPRTLAELRAVQESTNGTLGALAFATLQNDVLTESVRINNLGNVGIGTIEPDKLLTLRDADETPQHSVALRIKGSNNSDSTMGSLGLSRGIDFYTKSDTKFRTAIYSYFNEYFDANSALGFWTSQHGGTFAERVRISPNGNVGIGTTNPEIPLHIKRYIGSSGGILIEGDSAVTGAPKIEFRDTNAGPTSVAISFDKTHGISMTGGNVGIGTITPNYTLEVNGTFHAKTVSVMADVTADDYLFNSDARLKTDILPLENASEGIACLQGVTYRWSDPQASQELQLGLIAQEVERCFPEVVTTDLRGYKSVSYARLVAPLIENAKEQQQVSELQQRTLASQQQQLATQARELARLKSEQAATNARLARLEALLNARR